MALRAISPEELSAHSTRKGQDCWIALHGLVLKVDAKTLQEHPGGAQSILRVAGQDCTEEFEDAGHSDFAREWCNRLEVVGRLELRGEVPLRIARMFVYPIKACAGVEVDRAAPTQHGFAHDREYVFAAEQAVMAGAGESEGESSSFLKLLVPYDLPALAWIQPSLPTDDGMRIELLNSGDDENEGTIGSTCSFFVPRIASEGMCSAEGDSASGGGKMKYINMYKKCLLAGIDQGDAVSARVTDFLNKQHPDVLLPTTKVRLLLLTDRKLLNSETVHTGYYLQPRGSNYTPFMFMREGTIRAVNEKFFPGEPLRVTTLRFRPNVVFREEDCHFDSDWGRREEDAGEAANLDWSFCEDSWESISMRHHPSRFLQVLKSCGRCSHIFVNPARAVCDGDFLQKELCRLGRDGQGMIRKLESKLVQGVKNVGVNVNGSAAGEDVGVDVGVLAASVDPVLPWFRNHYQKFLDAGRTTKVFLGLCGSYHSHSLSGPQLCAGDNAFHVGQEWVANLSIRSLKEYGAEMRRPCQDNRAVIDKTRPIDLICAYGPDARGTIVRDADEGEDPFTSSQPTVFLPESRAARNTRRQVTVTEIVELSPTAKRIRFSFVKNGSFRKDNVGSYAPPALGLPCGHHIAVFGENPAFARSHWNHKRQTDAEKLPPTIKRSFTPIRCGRGYFDLVVKMYRKQQQPEELKSSISTLSSSTSSSNSKSIPFPDGGRLTGHFLDRLVVNDVVQIAGPFGHIRYVGGGRFRLGEERRFSQVGMVAGGSGITPMVQVLQFAAAERERPFQARLVYANKDECDVLCKELLEGERCRRVLAQCDAKYVISARGERISEDILRRSLPPPGAGSLVLLCGPPGMVEAAREFLRQIGHEDAQGAPRPKYVPGKRVLVLGGGAVGMFSAYLLLHSDPNRFVTVAEKRLGVDQKWLQRHQVIEFNQCILPQPLLESPSFTAELRSRGGPAQCPGGIAETREKEAGREQYVMEYFSVQNFQRLLLKEIRRRFSTRFELLVMESLSLLDHGKRGKMASRDEVASDEQKDKEEVPRVSISLSDPATPLPEAAPKNAIALVASVGGGGGDGQGKFSTVVDQHSVSGHGDQLYATVVDATGARGEFLHETLGVPYDPARTIHYGSAFKITWNQHELLEEEEHWAQFDAAEEKTASNYHLAGKENLLIPGGNEYESNSYYIYNYNEAEADDHRKKKKLFVTPFMRKAMHDCRCGLSSKAMFAPFVPGQLNVIKPGSVQGVNSSDTSPQQQHATNEQYKPEKVGDKNGLRDLLRVAVQACQSGGSSVSDLCDRLKGLFDFLRAGGVWGVCAKTLVEKLRDLPPAAAAAATQVIRYFEEHVRQRNTCNHPHPDSWTRLPPLTAREEKLLGRMRVVFVPERQERILTKNYLSRIKLSVVRKNGNTSTPAATKTETATNTSTPEAASTSVSTVVQRVDAFALGDSLFSTDFRIGQGVNRGLSSALQLILAGKHPDALREEAQQVLPEQAPQTLEERNADAARSRKWLLEEAERALKKSIIA
eukprot:g3708.t1